jgi:hypothetical protein
MAMRGSPSWSHGFDNRGIFESREEVNITGGSPYILAEALEALRPTPGGPNTSYGSTALPLATAADCALATTG